jgi:hypothetical protein
LVVTDILAEGVPQISESIYQYFMFSINIIAVDEYQYKATYYHLRITIAQKFSPLLSRKNDAFLIEEKVIH